MNWINFTLCFLLLGSSGMMLDALSRDPRGQSKKYGSTGFARLRRIRRAIAATLLGLVGVLIALWPVVPEQPRWVLAYTGSLMLVALGLLSMGVWDAIATMRQYRRVSRRRSSTGYDDLLAIVKKHQQNKDS